MPAKARSRAAPARHPLRMPHRGAETTRERVARAPAWAGRGPHRPRLPRESRTARTPRRGCALARASAQIAARARNWYSRVVLQTTARRFSVASGPGDPRSSPAPEAQREECHGLRHAPLDRAPRHLEMLGNLRIRHTVRTRQDEDGARLRRELVEGLAQHRRHLIGGKRLFRRGRGREQAFFGRLVEPRVRAKTLAAAMVTREIGGGLE